MIKLETSEDCGLESQEEILPDLPNTQFPLIKDEQVSFIINKNHQINQT